MNRPSSLITATLLLLTVVFVTLCLVVVGAIAVSLSQPSVISSSEVTVIPVATIPATVSLPLATTRTVPLTEATATATIPALTPLPIATMTAVVLQVHIVASGDTLIGIAQQYGLTSEQLMQVNHLGDTSLLYVGQELIIPPVNGAEWPPELLTAAAPPYSVTILGYSTQNRPIERYTFGSGPNQVVFVGSIHGGYEWNTTVLAYQAIDYFAAFPGLVPATITLHIIPTANPDGLYWITQKEGRISPNDILTADPAAALPGRFNAQDVDLNRNWDCNWSATAQWRDQTISGGTSPFSEVESRVLRDFFSQPGVEAVIFWHSAAALVSPGLCDEGIYQPSVELGEVYGAAAGYPTQSFLAYEITGDASDWLATQDIPAITVELTNHVDTDWPQNLSGMLAVLAYYQ